MLCNPTEATDRTHQADPATAAANQIRLAFYEAARTLRRVAEVNPALAETIEAKLAESEQHLADVEVPLAQIADHMRESWLTGELVEPTAAAE